MKDVYVIRPIAIFLLVVWHSFIVYAGGWSEPAGFQSIEVYWWLGKFSYSFMLELFVFISGYVFGLTLEKKKPTFKHLLENKFRRLIIPSIVFSTIYYFIFHNMGDFTIIGCFWNILGGCGHMWFLPMLFWVTLMAFVLDSIRLLSKVKLVGVFCLPVLSLLPFPLELSSAMYYLPFFYTGILIYRNYDEIISYIYRRKVIFLLLLLFVVMFICTTLISRNFLFIYLDSENLLYKGLAALCGKYLRILCAVSGVALVYSLINYIIVIKNTIIPQWIVDLNRTCFGVYLYQQFILLILYYKTSLPSLVGPYWLPWVGLSVTLILSFVLTKLCLKSKIGRQLI